MTCKNLRVLIAGEVAGVLAQDCTGDLTFQYLRSYRGIPLSSAMPVTTATYQSKTVLPYLWGLLPEDLATRRSVASEAGISPNNPFALLGVIGLDCPGAVQFCQQESNSLHEERIVPVNDADIAHRLLQTQTGNSGWIAEHERWSLGGQQGKFALRLSEGHWYSCEGAAATTHIFKSGIRGLAHQALNEYVCMRLATKIGIPTAHVAYRTFDGEPAIIVKRYDRQIERESVTRLHQEDLCQALGCLPDHKYASDGGPSCVQALEFLMTTGTAAQNNTVEFLQMLLFNYLIAATDAHAKNYSILLANDGAHRLAPMYDVASIAPYTDPARWRMKPPKLAMSIGGENRVGRLTMNNLRRLVTQGSLEKVGITTEGCANLLCAYADAIPQKLAEVFDELMASDAAVFAQELRAHMEEPITQLCKNAKAQL